MSRIYFCLVVTFFSFGILAETIQFECRSKDMDGINQFYALGKVNVKNDGVLDGHASFSTEKATEIASRQIFTDVEVEGNARTFGAGDIFKTNVKQLSLKLNHHYLKTLDVFLGSDIALYSKLFSIDNFLYRADCLEINSSIVE